MHQRKELNDEFRGEIFIMPSGKDCNHFMDGESTVQMWEEVYGPAIIQRRHRLMKPHARAALLFDAFTANESMSGGCELRRSLFEDNFNATHIQGDGKWSVHGSPCDALHAYWRKLCDALEEIIFGFDIDLDPFRRKSFEDLIQDHIGTAPKDCTSLRDVIEVGLWAFRSMPAPLRRWAWTSRGYFSNDEMAAMNNLDKDETEENGSVDKICNKFIEIASRPEVQPNPDSAKFYNKQCERVWLVAASCEDDCNDWRALPAWIGKTIEREISVYGEKLTILKIKKDHIDALEDGTTKTNLLTKVEHAKSKITCVHMLSSVSKSFMLSRSMKKWREPVHRKTGK